MISKQEYLNNFIGSVNGKGRAFDSLKDVCVYEMPHESGHSGCAVGCQPDFKKALALFPNNSLTGRVVWMMNNSGNLGKALQLVWGSEDTDFLTDLQYLHDQKHHWKDKQLKLSYVIEFCSKYSLKVPPSIYYVEQ